MPVTTAPSGAVNADTKYALYGGAPVVRSSSAAAHSRSSEQSRSPYSPVTTPQQLVKVTLGLAVTHVQARSAALRAVAAKPRSKGRNTRAAMAITAAKSAVAQELL